MPNKPKTITLLFYKRRLKLRVSRIKVQRNPVSKSPQKKEKILYDNAVGLESNSYILVYAISLACTFCTIQF